MEPALRAVVFDMDGLLADTERLSHRAWLMLLAHEYGITPDAGDDEWYRRMVGTSGLASWTTFRTMFALAFEIPDDIPRLRELHRGFYRGILAEGIAPMPGALELVAACREHGLRLALASSSTLLHIERVLAGIGLAGTFDAIASGEEVPRSKPDPAIYHLACERLDVAPAEAVALEDSGSGVAAARAAGLRCLAVPSAYTLAHDFSGACAVVPMLTGITPTDLAALR